jgi:hypothetical protein
MTVTTRGCAQCNQKKYGSPTLRTFSHALHGDKNFHHLVQIFFLGLS